jgi:hypothetical protein
MPEFDYSAMAELYEGPKPRQRGVRYLRFTSAAEALRFVVEEMPHEQAGGTMLEVDEDRFDMVEIEALYHAEAYPLRRMASAP